MAKDELESAETEGGGNKKKMFIIIGAAVAAVVILGVVAFLLMGKGDGKKAQDDETKTEAKAESGHGGGEAGAQKEGAAAANIYSLEPFIVNIYDGQDLRYLRVKVEMDVASEEVKTEMEARKAQFRDAILVLLSTKTLLDVRDEQGKNQLRQEIFTAVNNILSPGKLKRVYFTDFVVQ